MTKLTPIQISLYSHRCMCWSKLEVKEVEKGSSHRWSLSVLTFCS